MLTISKPLNAGQARRYHAEEFQNARENYYTDRDQIRGTWHGQLALRWGLIGEVSEEQFQRLADGRHPMTGEQLVRHQTARQMKDAHGHVVTTMIGLRAPTPGRRHGRGPRLHDMRHRFAAATLVAWYRAGRDVERHLPSLATYLGHVHVNDTYWYLEAVPELLALAAARLAVIPAERVP